MQVLVLGQVRESVPVLVLVLVEVSAQALVPGMAVAGEPDLGLVLAPDWEFAVREKEEGRD